MMMKPAFLVSLAFLALLVEAHGIRLEQGFMSLGGQRDQEDKNRLVNEVAAGAGVECRSEHCSGRSRKLMVLTPSTTSTTTTTTETATKTEQQPRHEIVAKGKKESFSIESSPVSDHREVAADHYPDILDIAGMDYSSAKRKPPIHN